MKTYQFSYIRYIHDVSTEEFVNIGIVMFIPSERKFLFRLTEHYARLSEFYLDFKASDYRYLLRSLKSRLNYASGTKFSGRTSDIGKILPEIVPIESGCFQWSGTMSGVVEKPEIRLERLFAKVITAHEKSKTRTRRDDKDISDNFHNQLMASGLIDNIKTNVPIQNQNTKYSYQFKYGWQNGTMQFAEPLSLDYKNKKDLENKVSSFIGDMFSLGDKEYFQVTGIVSPPTKKELQQDFNNAVKRLTEVPQIREVISETEIPFFIPKIEQDIFSNQLNFESNLPQKLYE